MIVEGPQVARRGAQGARVGALQLGKVTKPRRIKDAKLVVVKQTGKNPVAMTLAAAKKK